MPFARWVQSSHWGILMAVALLLAASVIAAWLWTRRDELPKGQRGRLRDVRWRVALIAVALLATATVYPLFMRANLRWWWLIVPLSAAAVQALDDRMAEGLVPLWLTCLGVYGLEVARHVGSAHSSLTWYGVAQAGAGSATTYLVLPQAYAYLIIGGWLAWRSLAARPRAAQLVLGRMASAPAGAARWGLLLLPAAIAAAGLIGSGAWFVVMLALAIGALLVIRRSPLIAARLATAGIIAIGIAGLVLARDWFGGTHLMRVAVADPASVAAIKVHAARMAKPVVTVVQSAVKGHAALTSGLVHSYIVQVLAPPAIPTSYVGVNVSSPSMANLVAAEGLALLAFGCWLAPRTFPEVRGVLGLAPYGELTKRVQRLTESRALVADTAAADLRRLERNLHDGAQARLVALGMSLRAAEKLVHASPDAASALIAEARDTSARALTELRELFKGVHPPVLADRGLADAVLALALDSPLQVETEIDLPGRVPAPVETACYFAVSEVLTNAAKHSGARDARIGVSHTAGVLRIVVTDFGLGGADPARGTGLAGVEKRLATFDGILAVSSPVGGPTTIVIEVPCALAPAAPRS
jgi:signal transduction histidine kinase